MHTIFSVFLSRLGLLFMIGGLITTGVYVGKVRDEAISAIQASGPTALEYPSYIDTAIMYFSFNAPPHIGTFTPYIAYLGCIAFYIGCFFFAFQVLFIMPRKKRRKVSAA